MIFATRVLEFDKILARLADKSSFSVGRELALSLEPTADWVQAERRQAGTAEALRLMDSKPDLGLGGAHDVRPQVQRAALGGMLLPGELVEVAGLVRCARRWITSLTRLEHLFPTLAEDGRRLAEHRPLLEEIDAAISETGEVLDSASSELRRLRAALRVAQERVRSRLQEIISSPSTRVALQEPIITERNGRYVVPVKAEARSKLKGIVHDQSASGATLFVEPLEVVELANRSRQLQLDEEREIERILLALSRQVAADAAELLESVAALGELDLQLAKARLAANMRATRPLLRDFEASPTGSEPVLRLVEARHPLLGPGAVPLSLDLGLEFDVLVISGPNTGGKTVALKTIGLLALMAQAGLQLPAADGCIVTVFRSIHADVGDEQSIEQSLSTFSSHVGRIVEMLREADNRSLVLLDELGAGTDPQEGSALAHAILEHLRLRRVFCVATTHYSDLKLYAHGAPRVENASVEFDVQTLSPTYRLLVGLPGRSSALDIAARLGIPRVILERAKSVVDPADVEASELLDRIHQERQMAEETRQEAEQERQAAARARASLEEELAEQQRSRQKVWEEAEQASRQELAALGREVAALRAQAQRIREDQMAGIAPDSAVSGREGATDAAVATPVAETGKQAIEQLAARAEALESIARPPELRTPSRPAEASAAEAEHSLVLGAAVLVPSLGLSGSVTRLDGEEAEVDVRGMRVRLKRAELRMAHASASDRDRAGPRSREYESASVVVLKDRERPVALQLDLRGQRREEATQELDRYLHDAYLAGLKTVRVIHGKGTGVVRQAVHELLGSHTLVRRYAGAPREAGGDGATEVELVG